MKKTLAAVLAAAMALSTATVAFAKDTDAGEIRKENGDVVSDEDIIVFGKDNKYIIEGIGPFSQTDLGKYVDNNRLSISAIVTDGSNRLASKPTFSIGLEKDKDPEGNGTYSPTYSYKWYGGPYVETGLTDGLTLTANTLIPVDNSGTLYATTVNPTTLMKWGDFIENADGKKWVDNNKSTNPKDKDLGSSKYILEEKTGFKENQDTDKGSGKSVLMKFKVADDYRTDEPVITMKLRVTVKKDFKVNEGTLNEVSYKKGDTYTTDEFKFKVKYGEMERGKDMQLTLNEVDARNVILKGDKLYDEIGNDTFTITFEDVAVFEGKLSASQKKLNLFYDLDEKTMVTDQYPDVDFEFITFRGGPAVTRFVNSGKMIFHAIGGKNTTVYRLETAGGGDDGDTLVPISDPSDYNSTYDTITVKGIKDLSGTFVIASEILEVEDDEDNEPVDTPPVVEEPSSSEPTTVVEKNPSTGAC